MKNISDRELTLQQTKVLAKGLNFAVSPDKVQVDEFVVATEKACWLLPENVAEELRYEVSGILKNAKPPPSNLTKGERQALRELSKDEQTMIFPADKGKATVIMNKDVYESKVSGMLWDEQTYEKLNKDPTASYKRKLIGILTRLKREEKIDEGQYRYLYPTTEVIPRMYCTPKIHKQGNPLRPIVDY